MALPLPEIHHLYQLGVAIDYHIRVVRDHNQLSAQLVLPDLPNNQFINQMVVQVVFWLIQYQWLIAKSQQKGKQSC